MLKINKISSYLLVCINVLLLFLLIFEAKVQIPLALSPFGRLHPLLLHLPIGFAVILLVFYWFRNEIERTSFVKIFQFLLNITAVSASLVALFGFFLSQEGGFEPAALQVHKWTGVAVSFFSFGLATFYDKLNFHKNSSGSWALVIFMAVAGHFGASITHGENYLWEAYQNKDSKPTFTENSTLYEATIFPILEAKCVTCHNDQKTKGQLNMSSIQKILVGGKNGAIWKAGDVLNSHIIERANLPIDDKLHMPPKGKAQLTLAEIDLITAWIREGADVKMSIKQYPQNSAVKTMAMSLINAKPPTEAIEKAYTFAAATASSITDVNTPYCSVFPMANNSPALQADFFVSKNFDIKNLENLSKVADQIVVLNLGKMPIKDQDLKLISKFPNLEKLVLNQTDITGSTLDQLVNCKKLQSLALIGTKVKKENVDKIIRLPLLKELYLWETSIKANDIALLQKNFPKIKFDKGFEVNPNEMLRLNPPMFSDENFVIKDNAVINLKHSLKDVTIIYTTDGSDPDSTSKSIFTKPFTINTHTRLKTIAVKNGWYASRVLDQQFFKHRYLPDYTEFLKKPDEQYDSGGTKILTDLKKGSIDNNSGQYWSGYRDNDFATEFSFNEAKPFKGITVSYLQGIPSYIMPPIFIEVWAGDTRNSMKLLAKHYPTQPKSSVDPIEIQGYNLDMNGSYKIVKVIARPVSKLPNWHPGKGQKGWFFVDEVFFY
jgi:uncharacterized membrane protein